MATEFEKLFDEWASTYDATVSGVDQEYKAVFEDYDVILEAVANEVSGRVMEFGVGTGNLSIKLIEKEVDLLGIEPSKNMREAAKKKLPQLQIEAGDFLRFPQQKQKLDGIVSSYAFHHLTNDEKEIAVAQFFKLLRTGGKVAFADTIFLSENHHKQMIKEAKNNKYFHLAEDLEREYYATVPFIKEIFEQAGFEVTIYPMNEFVRMIRAVKI